MSSNHYIVDGLETERLRFRRVTMEDAIPWQEFFASPDYLEYILADANDPEAARKWMKKQLGRYEDTAGGHCAVILKETNELIGQCGLLWQELEHGEEWEIGYHFIPRYWGKGYATEAAIAVKEEGFRRGIDTVISLIHQDNKASQKVAEKNGMVCEGIVDFKGLNAFLYRVSKN